jgi:uncharacterized repeat protein (TIGR04076 family)
MSAKDYGFPFLQFLLLKANCYDIFKRKRLSLAASENIVSRREDTMAKDPKIGYKVVGTITGVKGICNAGHVAGESFEISCHNPAGLCGFFYHDMFPNLSTLQFGGTMPWWQGDTIELQCPDSHNLVTLKLTRSKQ